SAEKSHNLVFKLRFCHEVTVFLRKHHCITARLSTRDDCHFVHHIGIIKHHADHCMPGFVECDDIALFLRDDFTLLGRTSNDSVSCLIHITHINLAFVSSCGNQGRLVEKVLKVCTGESRRPCSKCSQVNRLIKRFVFRMYSKYCFTAFDIRTADRNLSVKTSRTEQCRIKDVRSVCSGYHDDAFVFPKAVHFYKKLVKCLFTLIVTTADTCATLPADSIDL